MANTRTTCTTITHPEARSFLNYTENPDEIAADPDGMYPQGRNMWLGFYSSSGMQMDDMVRRGLPFDGPHYGNGSFDDTALIQHAAKGLKALSRLYRVAYASHDLPTDHPDYRDPDPANPAHKVGACDSDVIYDLMKTAAGRAVTTAKLESIIGTMVNQTTPIEGGTSLNDAVAGWYICPDELKDDDRSDHALLYMGLVQAAVDRIDPQKRPVFYSTVARTKLHLVALSAKITSPFYQNYKIADMAQQYWHAKFSGSTADVNWPTGTSDQDRAQYRGIIHELIDQMVNDVGATPDSQGRKRPVIWNSGCYLDPGSCDYNQAVANGGPYYLFDSTNRLVPAWIAKVITHDTWLAVAKGCHGVMPYSRGSNANYMRATWNRQQLTYLNTFEIMQNSGFAHAMLWGTIKKGNGGVSIGTYADHNNEVEKNFTYGVWRTARSRASIYHQDVQYKDKRFIVIINSHPEKDGSANVGRLRVVVGGLPYTSQVVVTDLVSGNIKPVETGGNITLDMLALSTVVLEVAPAPGYGIDCVDVGGPPPTVEATLPAVLNKEVGQSAQFSARAKDEDAASWQYQDDGSTTWLDV